MAAHELKGHWIITER